MAPSSSLFYCFLIIVHPQVLAFLLPSKARYGTSISFKAKADFQQANTDIASTVDMEQDVEIASSSTNTTTITTTLEAYEYDGWNLTYRFKRASEGYENNPPVLLIHPVGIGMASWFWEPFMETWRGPSLYAPNLIGCGISEGGDAWNPDERGLNIPLGWVRGCEALMSHIDGGCGGSSQKRPNTKQLSALKSPRTFLKRIVSRDIISSTTPAPWTVVTQGGLASLGVLLAARNPTKIDNLVMASPPTWRDMTTALPESELSRNYNFLRSPLWGSLAFRLLESRKAVEFFSNLFLFSMPCDSTWLDKAEREFGVLSRPPVQVFNGGFCMSRGLEPELTELEQSTLIMQGSDDKRCRRDFVDKMKNCQTENLSGKNVVPWESSREFAELLSTYLTKSRL